MSSGREGFTSTDTPKPFKQLSTASYSSTSPRVREFFGPQRFWLHIILFVATFVTTSMAGVAWLGGDALEVTNLPLGFSYAAFLLLFLTAHEFGHFIAARIHRVQATLPFYIPIPGQLLGLGINFGTLGAVIRLRSQMPSRKANFDIGVAGPIAGFVVCLVLLAVGFYTLPGIDYLQAIHPGYPEAPKFGGVELAFGKTLLYSAMESAFAPHGAYIPPMTEMYHYPMLCVGWFGLFVTALNLLPIGQLDGGHIIYSMFPKHAHRGLGIATASTLFVLALPEVIGMILSALEIVTPSFLETVTINGGSTWLLWAIIVTFVVKFRHPETLDESPIGPRRMALGFFAIVIFLLCFTPAPIQLIEL